MFEKALNRRAATRFFGRQAAGELRDSENRRRTISGKIYLRRLRGQLFGQQPAEDAPNVSELRASARRGCGELRGSKNRKIHTRQPNPRQKRFRTKDGRGDEA